MAGNVPSWQAPRNGMPGDLGATDDPAGINQHLGTHQLKAIAGAPVVRPSSAGQYSLYFGMGNSDFAQKITLSGTSVGRVTIPIQAVGNGANVLLTLCADNAGVPSQDAPIAQTLVPAEWITNLTAPNGLAAGGPLAHPDFNAITYESYASKPWISPAATVNGAPSYAAAATSGNYTIFVAGHDTVGAAPVAIVNTAQYLGSGTVGSPVPQPPLPTATYYGSAATTSDTVVYMGGQTSASGYTKAVWSASWDSNTGTVGAWSSQNALPVALTQAGGASWGSSVYLVGGNTTGSSSSGTATVYRATVTNGQLSAWTTETPLPQALSFPYVAAIGDWLIVAGGVSTSNTVQSTTYYAPIRPDGSLGAWKPGPDMVGPSYGFSPTWCAGSTDSALIIYGGAQNTSGTLSPLTQILTVGSLGVASEWTAWQAISPGERAVSVFSDGDGSWTVIAYNVDNTYLSNPCFVQTLLSAPLYATGLTSGASYWIVAQQYQGASSSDSLYIGFLNGAYPDDGLISARYAQSWGPASSSYSIPLTVYDASTSPEPLHTVEDPVTGPGGTSVINARWTTLVLDDTGLLRGVCETTMQPNSALNSNPTFTSGTTPWTATNGTLTQSSAQTHGGYPYSGLLTPTGGFTSAYAQSEQMAVHPGVNEFYGKLNWYFANGCFYSPNGWADFSLSITWYDSAGNTLSTSTTTTALTAATWTQVTTRFACPAGAATATLTPTLGGSPAVTDLLYLSDVTLTRAPESVPALASVAEITYPAPSSGQANAPSWPPTGVVQLA